MESSDTDAANDVLRSALQPVGEVKMEDLVRGKGTQTFQIGVRVKGS